MRWSSRFLLGALLVGLACSRDAMAQPSDVGAVSHGPYAVPELPPSPAFKTAVAVSPLGMLLGYYELKAEHSWTPGYGVMAQFWAHLNDDLSLGVPESDTSGFAHNVEFGASWVRYFSDRDVSGGWFSAGVSGGSIDYLQKTTVLSGLSRLEAKGIVVGPRVQTGYHWIWDSGLLVGIHVGLGYNVLFGRELSLEGGTVASGVDVNGLLLIGWAI